MEIVETLRLVVVPRAGVEPARGFPQRILSPVQHHLLSLTKRYKPILTGLTAVKELFHAGRFSHVLASS